MEDLDVDSPDENMTGEDEEAIEVHPTRGETNLRKAAPFSKQQSQMSASPSRKKPQNMMTGITTNTVGRQSETQAKHRFGLSQHSVSTGS